MKFFDIKNPSGSHWRGPVTVQLAAPGRGMETVTIPPGGVLEGVSESRISDHVRFLTRTVRERPPVLELVEVDHLARVAAREQERLVLVARAKNIKVSSVAPVASPPVELPAEASIKKKFKKEAEAPAPRVEDSATSNVTSKPQED